MQGLPVKVAVPLFHAAATGSAVATVAEGKSGIPDARARWRGAGGDNLVVWVRGQLSCAAVSGNQQARGGRVRGGSLT